MALESIGALAHLADPPAARAMVEETTVSLGSARAEGEAQQSAILFLTVSMSNLADRRDARPDMA